MKAMMFIPADRREALSPTNAPPGSVNLNTLATGLAVLFLSALVSFAAEEAASQSAARDTEALLKSINTGYYGKPSIPLKTNENYAHSSSDVEPYGGVKPYKEHFLVQMEYAGSARGLGA